MFWKTSKIFPFMNFNRNSSNDLKNSIGQDKSEVELTNEELKPPKEASEAPDWKKTSGQDRKSPDSLQEHLSDLQKRQQLSVSDRHVYKYRCNHCSLAFRPCRSLRYIPSTMPSVQPPCAICASAASGHSLHFESIWRLVTLS